jgi:OFA family oxalate/formate antiporter-like MFS transporter
VILTSLTSSSIALLYLTYGVVAGIGLGLGYIVPIATLIKWFPDKRGVITGIAVAGFGAGAVVTAPIAKRLIASVGVFETFAILGVIYAVAVIGAAMFIKNPPEGYKPEGWEPDTAEHSDRSGREFEFGEAVKTWQWFALWSLLFLNVTAGIAVISEAAPMAEEVAGASATAAASLVSLIAIFNGFGRFAWASFSDVIGRRWVFLTMFVLQIGLFVLLPSAGSYGLFAVLACAILLCYGGGFGTMPAFAADYFGSKNVGRIYGLMLTAWSAGGVVGPLLISKIRDSTGAYDTALYIIAGIMAASCIIPLIVRPPAREPAPEREPAGRFTRKEAAAVSDDRESTRTGA